MRLGVDKAEPVANVATKQECCLQPSEGVPDRAGHEALLDPGLTLGVFTFQEEDSVGVAADGPVVSVSEV